MPLPIIPGTEVQTPNTGVKMNVSSFRNAALMKGEVAGAAGDSAADFMRGLSRDIQDMRDAKVVYDADIAMQETTNNFEASLSKDPNLMRDPNTWLPAYKAKVAETKDTLLGQPHMSLAAKNHVTMMTGNWATETTSRVQMSALKRETTDTYNSGVANSELAYKSAPGGNVKPDEVAKWDNVKRGDVAVQSLYERGLINKEELGQRIEAGHQQAIVSKATDVLNNGEEDPIIGVGAVKAVEKYEKYLTPQAYKPLITRAHGIVKAAQTANVQADSKSIQAGAEVSIDARERSGLISPEGADELRIVQKRIAKDKTDETKEKETDVVKLVRLHADEYDWSSPDPAGPTPKVFASQLTEKAAGLTNPVLKEEINNIVLQKQRAAAQKVEKPSETQVKELGRRYFSSGLFRPVTVAETQEEVPGHWYYLYNDKTTKTVTTVTAPGIEKNWDVSPPYELWYKATQQQADWNQKMHDYLTTFEKNSKGKEPTESEINAEGKRLMEDRVSQLTKNTVTGDKLPEVKVKEDKAQFKKGQQSPQNGWMYEFDGTKWQPLRPL